MKASNSLLGVLLIDFVAGLVAFFRDGKHARGRERLQRIGRFRMNHPHAKPEIVAAIDERESGHDDHKNASGESAGGDQGDSSLLAVQCNRPANLTDQRGNVALVAGFSINRR